MTDRNLEREAHIWSFALEHDIDVEIGSVRGAKAYRRQPKHGLDQPLIRIPAIRGQVSYFVALHELGHILGHGSGLVRLEEEALAWRWALANTEEQPTVATYRAIKRRLASYMGRALRRSNMTLPGAGSEFHRLMSELMEVTR